ncbi:MAG: hypothetical protein SRB1_01200 [Desulfobacteraceae bacterium Eth-SRB1]|nr:MAG: hypothetical protein SRB1_01200 [Desulfobacteraceae bacterium Eth-SRB1]
MDKEEIIKIIRDEVQRNLEQKGSRMLNILDLMKRRTLM